MSRIAQNTSGNCVGHSISIIRIALGYNTPLPSWYKQGFVHANDLATVLSDCLPEHTVHVWCDMTDVGVLTGNLRYMGTFCPLENREDYEIMCFAYKQADGSGNGHMVIGQPAAVDGMQILFIAGISRK